MYELPPVTRPWGALLVRMLNIIDAIEQWNTGMVEELYIRSDGQVDKLFPAKGDILAVYLVEGRIYKGSPQGWFVLTANQFKRTVTSGSPYFWARCCFHSDIPPIPDTSVPWNGECDFRLMREKLANKPMWLRLCATEEFGCSYYNLSDWVNAKRQLNAGINDTSTGCSRGETVGHRASVTHSKRKLSPNNRFPIDIRNSSLTSKMAGSISKSAFKRRRGRAKFSEYVAAESLSESSESDIIERSILQETIGVQSSIFENTLFTLTTGKVSDCMNTNASTPASGSTNTSPCQNAKINSEVSDIRIPKSVFTCSSRINKDPRWIRLRQETCTTFFNLIVARMTGSSAIEWATNISQQVEEETVFTKCMYNEDRYIGLCRAVCGILKQFDCLLDSLETLIPIDDHLRMKLYGLQNDQDNLVLYIQPFTNDNS